MIELTLFRINKRKVKNEKIKKTIIGGTIGYFVFAFILSFLISTNMNLTYAGKYMIGNDNESNFVIVCIDSDYAITEKCEIVKNDNETVLKINTTEQTIKPLDNLSYKNVSVNKTIWEGNE